MTVVANAGPLLALAPASGKRARPAQSGAFLFGTDITDS